MSEGWEEIIQDIEQSGDAVQRETFRSGIWRPWVITASAVLIPIIAALAHAEPLGVISSMLTALIMTLFAWNTRYLRAEFKAADWKYRYALSYVADEDDWSLPELEAQADE